jgi:methionine-rich copper-binding protein CopC
MGEFSVFSGKVDETRGAAMRPVSKSRFLALMGGLSIALACAALAGISAEKTEPEDGATLSRPPSALRVWFSEAPDVELSGLELEGPTGELEVEGLHTMGRNDLMGRIVGKVVDGEYKASWKTVDSGGEELTGEWTFTVKRGG